MTLRLSSSLPDDPKYANGRVYYDNLVKYVKADGLGDQLDRADIRMKPQDIVLTVASIGALIWILLSVGAIPGIVGKVGGVAFLVQFILVWLGVWLVANGPMRVPFIRWRFRGGRLA